MKGFKACCMACAMYSRIPVPTVEWTEENRRYVLCFFPLVGVVTGLLGMLWYAIGKQWLAGTALYAVVAACIPLWVNGGIHMDGYMDVCDARACLSDKERKLEVMKDSRVGAFAVIRLAEYLLLQVAFLMQVANGQMMLEIAMGYVLSRAWSALGAAIFVNARGEGSLAQFTRPEDKRVTIRAACLWIGICTVVMLLVHVWMGLAALTASVLAFGYYRWIAYREFGGVTGDLAGYFLQICELAILIAVTAVHGIQGMIG